MSAPQSIEHTLSFAEAVVCSEGFGTDKSAGREVTESSAASGKQGTRQNKYNNQFSLHQKSPFIQDFPYNILYPCLSTSLSLVFNRITKGNIVFGHHQSFVNTLTFTLSIAGRIAACYFWSTLYGSILRTKGGFAT
jgi:hypothetical protein